MSNKAHLRLEHLEDRTALNSPAAMIPYDDPGYGSVQQVYGAGPSVQVAGWSAAPLYSPYGSFGFGAYYPDAMVLTYTVVNLGSETSQGTNIVISGQPVLGSFGGYYSGAELATLAVGSLAPGQVYTETVVVPLSPMVFGYGPLDLDVQAYSYYSPPPGFTTGFGVINPLGGNGFLDFNDLGASQGLGAAGGVLSAAQEAVVQPTLAGVAAVGGAVTSGDGPLAGLIDQMRLEEADVVPVTQEQAQGRFQGIEAAPLSEPLQELTPDSPPEGRDGGDVEEPAPDEMEQMEEELLFRRPARRDEVPDWLKPLLKDQGEPRQPKGEERPVQLPGNPEERLPLTPARAEVVPPRSQKAQAPVANQEQVAQAPAAEESPKVVVDRRGQPLTEQQARMAYFVLLGTGLAALQRQLQPARPVEDRENPRRKRLTRI